MKNEHLSHNANSIPKKIYRGEIYMVETFGKGYVHNGFHPAVIIQNDIGNRYSPLTKVASICSKSNKDIITHMNIELLFSSTIMCEQIHTIDKSQLKHKVGQLTNIQIEELDDKLQKSLGIKWI